MSNASRPCQDLFAAWALPQALHEAGQEPDMASKQGSRPSDQELTSTFRRMRDELQAIAAKAGELERDAEEYSLVIDTLRTAKTDDPSRKCFRMVGGVLIERTVSDILPSLETNYEGIVGIVKGLSQQYEKKDAELRDFQTKWNIRVVNQQSS